jgi:hypothetical protein
VIFNGGSHYRGLRCIRWFVNVSRDWSFQMSGRIDYELPCEAVVRKIDDMYSVQIFPVVEIDGAREPMFLGGLQFRIVDGKPVDITTDPTEWNRRLEIRCQEFRE